ncbi:peptidoglycan DD-metalloendopeptidase family protein [Streptomyces sp. NPDC001930]|uniref:peptidoglycan DD-metalloendopeptidase family protein n=1 Tax=Streptomyces sp. NPDC001930 TaxID=3364625 RepID=UPI0036B4745A
MTVNVHVSSAPLRAALLAFLTALALTLGTGATTAGATPAGATTAGATPAAAPPAGKPAFQLPFACGTKWRLDTWAHTPALDVVKEGNPGSDGLPVYASAPGTVSAAYWDDGSGNTLQISHGNGWFTAYYHLQEAPDAYVKVGRQVTGATQIGRVGKSGAADKWAHLHYEQRHRASGTDTDESHRRPVHFDGVEYSGAESTWASVTSANCAQPQTAPYQPWNCPNGSVCFYAQPGGKGAVCRTDSDVPASPCGLRGSFFNNGHPQEGTDHAYVVFKEGGSACLHHGWGEGRGDFASGGRTVKSVTWGGECPAVR